MNMQINSVLFMVNTPQITNKVKANILENTYKRFSSHQSVYSWKQCAHIYKTCDTYLNTFASLFIQPETAESRSHKFPSGTQGRFRLSQCLPVACGPTFRGPQEGYMISYIVFFVNACTEMSVLQLQ